MVRKQLKVAEANVVLEKINWLEKGLNFLMRKVKEQDLMLELSAEELKSIESGVLKM